jgi:hypothetical protein
VNQPACNLRFNADWQVPWLEGLSLDLGVTQTSPTKPASTCAAPAVLTTSFLAVLLRCP